MKLTDKQINKITDIASRAAQGALTKVYTSGSQTWAMPVHNTWAMAVHNKSTFWIRDKVGRDAYTNAVIAEFEKLNKKKQVDARKSSDFAVTLQMEADMSHIELLTKDLSELSIKYVKDTKDLQDKLAVAEKQLAELTWRPISVKPTKADANSFGNVLFRAGKDMQFTPWDSHTILTCTKGQWLPLQDEPIDADMLAQFENWYAKEDPRTPQNPFEKKLAWAAWQAAWVAKKDKT